MRRNGAVAQLVEHLLCKQGVRSSNLLSSTIRLAPHVRDSLMVNHSASLLEWSISTSSQARRMTLERTSTASESKGQLRYTIRYALVCVHRKGKNWKVLRWHHDEPSGENYEAQCRHGIRFAIHQGPFQLAYFSLPFPEQIGCMSTGDADQEVEQGEEAEMITGEWK